MSEPIQLTDAERKAAVEKVQALYCMDLSGPLDHMITAINKVRAGDPVGTVRLDQQRAICRIARKTDQSYCPWQLAVFEGNDFYWDSAPESYVKGWPVIYTPEVSE